MSDNGPPPISEELRVAAESVYEGWYSGVKWRPDWEDIVDRVERMSGVDLGDSMTGPLVLSVKNYINWYRKQDT